MTFAGMQTKAVGNIVYTANYQFYIDQACAGLNMLNVSLLLGTFMVGMQQKKQKKEVHLLRIICLLGCILLLNIISNFFRILLIVVFKLMPGTALHDIAGLLCMIIYVVLPLLYLSNLLVRHFGKAKGSQLQNKPAFFPTGIKHQLLCIGLSATLALILIAPKNRFSQNENRQNVVKLKGYHCTNLENNILKFENNHSLIYMKPTPFYAPEHNPMICWVGSGYVFNVVQKQFFNSIEVYTGTLEKGKDKIYAAWWFDNGKIKTINQFKWRWNATFGKDHFYLINVNTAKKADLQKVVESLLQQ